MKISTTMVGPPIGARLQLVAAWAALVGLTLIYWETCRLAHGAATLNLTASGLWMVEIWSGWLVISLPAYEWCRRQRLSRTGISLRQALALMVVLSVLALSCEWLLNMTLSQQGAIKRWESAWEMFNHRALMCVVVSGALVWFATRPDFVWRRLAGFKPPSPDLSQPSGNEAALILMDRGQSITVPLHDVEAILAAENYVEICTISGKQYLHRMTLAGIERELDTSTMLRVHRSVIVNVSKVRSRLPGWRLQLTSGRTVRVGRSFREAVENRMRDVEQASASPINSSD